MNIDLKTLPFFETVAVLLIIILAVGGVYLLQQKGDGEDRLVDVEARLGRAQSTLRGLNNNGGVDALTEELEDLQSDPGPQLFPSREEASNLFPSIANRVQELAVDLIGFNSTEKTLHIEGLEGSDRPLISYAFTALGEPEDLLGVLSLINDYPTVIVQALKMDSSEGQWAITADLALFYHVDVTLEDLADKEDEGE
ncbi:MAG: hypothetical protein IH955_05415 [Chloroflexi bacterium]|nr:hypothetical protein [Chloroflexota bacterium]